MSPSIISSSRRCGLINRLHRVIGDDAVVNNIHPQHIHHQHHHDRSRIITSPNSDHHGNMIILLPTTTPSSHHNHHGFALQSRENRDRLRAQDKALRSMERERQRRLTDGGGSRWTNMSNIHRVFIAEIARQCRQRLRAQEKAKHEMDAEKQRRIGHLASMFPSMRQPIVSKIHRVFVILGGVGKGQGERVLARDKAIQTMETERQRRQKMAMEYEMAHDISNIQRVWITEAHHLNRQRIRAQHIAVVSAERERQRRLMSITIDSEMVSSHTGATAGIISNVQRVWITEFARENRERIRAEDAAIQCMEAERMRRINRMMERCRFLPRAFECRVLPDHSKNDNKENNRRCKLSRQHQ